MKTRNVQFGECAQIINGFAFKSDLFTTERTGLPVVRIRDVVRDRAETYYSGEYPQNALVSNGDLLIGMDGEFNLGEWRGGVALLNQRVCKIAARDGMADTGYLKYATRIVLKRIEANQDSPGRFACTSMCTSMRNTDFTSVAELLPGGGGPRRTPYSYTYSYTPIVLAAAMLR